MNIRHGYANRARSEIGYIMTIKKRLIQKCSVLDTFNTGSDRRPIRCKMLDNTKGGRIKLFQHYKKTVD